MYKKELFELLHSETFPLYLTSKNGERDCTHDVLLVKGNLNGELVHILVNHWTSRRSGGDFSEVKRIKAAELVVRIVEKINSETEKAKVIIMSDFNDDPTNISVKNIL